MSLRETNLKLLDTKIFDVIVIGGGINGAVSAAALAAKGSSVGLVEKKDFASFTSQESSNLAWGGIKYLESNEFKLVWGLCASRNRLMKSFPSQIKEIRFYTALPKNFRKHRLLILMGTWLYWFMGRCFTVAPRLLSKTTISKEEPCINTNIMQGGVEYSDSYLVDNDARFVFKFVRKAMDYGCAAANYLEAASCRRENDLWITKVKDHQSGKEFTIRSRSIVNATGPFTDRFNQRTGIETLHHHLFSKGVHLIVPKISQNRKVLTFFANDGRMFFVIPMGPRSCIGTTDTRVTELPPQVYDDDRKFILDNINERLKLSPPLGMKDIVAERCGVRPLVVKNDKESNGADWIHLSRKHEIEVDRERQFISIFGGKLTDCINIGEEVVKEIRQLKIEVPNSQADWFGEPDEKVWIEYQRQARSMQLDGMTAIGSSEPLSVRLWRRYGLRALEILEDIREDNSMAELLIENAEYIKAELHFAAKSEMIITLEDFLRRRSKIALVAKHEVIKNAPGLKKACDILFGEHAAFRYQEYFSS